MINPSSDFSTFTLFLIQRYGNLRPPLHTLKLPRYPAFSGVSTSLCAKNYSFAGALRPERLVLVSFWVTASIVNALSHASLSLELVGAGSLPRHDSSTITQRQLR